MVLDQRENLLRFVIRKPEAAADFSRHGHAYFHVAVKTDAVWSAAEGRRLAHIVQQCSPGKGRGTSSLQLFKKHESMRPNVAFRMELRRLLHALHASDFG